MANGILTINAGLTSGTINITGIVNDSLDEPNETVIVALSNPSNATLGTNNVHTYTINDNDNAPVVEFNNTSSNDAESVSSKAITVDLSAASSQDVTVNCMLSQVLPLALAPTTLWLMVLQQFRPMQHQRRLPLGTLLMTV